MWFKNLIVYRLPDDWSVSARELEDKLTARQLMPCGSFDMQSKGWVFASDLERYVHTINGQHLIALGVDQKLLPGSIIRQVATERAKEMAKEQGYPVGRRQMRELKMRVTEELRGRALTRKRVTHAWIDPINHWLVVNASSEGKAEELVETLRDTIGGSLQVTLLETERSASATLTAWLMLGDAPLTFTIDDDAELQAADESKPTIRYVRHPLDGKEIRAQIQSGMFATRLGLTWKDRISFVLNEKLHVKKLEFLLIDKDKPEEGSSVSPAEQFDIDFTLMAGELNALLKDLAVVLGNEQPQQAAAA
jgi:recombination associated protein RdgC